MAMTSAIQQVVVHLRLAYEERVLSMCTPPSGRGRPALDIREEQLRFLLDNNFKVASIAAMFGCSRQTIQRRMRSLGIEPNRYTSISDVELDGLVSGIVARLPTCGICSVQSMLRAEGVTVQRQRISESLRRVDPVGTLHRRTYHVHTPNALWLIDGNHKLNQWEFVVRGGIDGYSRIPVYLRVAITEQKPCSPLSQKLFQTRACHRVFVLIVGEENMQVARFMIGYPGGGTGKGSFVMGRCVHNERIERLWRDV